MRVTSGQRHEHCIPSPSPTTSSSCRSRPTCSQHCVSCRCRNFVGCCRHDAETPTPCSPVSPVLPTRQQPTSSVIIQKREPCKRRAKLIQIQKVHVGKDPLVDLGGRFPRAGMAHRRTTSADGRRAMKGSSDRNEKSANDKRECRSMKEGIQAGMKHRQQQVRVQKQQGRKNQAGMKHRLHWRDWEGTQATPRRSQARP